MNTSSDQAFQAYHIGPSIFRIGFGDLVQSSAEVIVSSDDNYITMGGGVSRRILHAGGGAIQDHARKLIPLVVGDVAVTTAGDLGARYIFHAITLDHKNRRTPDGACLVTLVKRSLALAEALKVRSLAFPALGTGAARVPMYVAANAMVRTVADYLTKGTTIEEVSVHVYGRLGVPRNALDDFYAQAMALGAVAGQSKHLRHSVAQLRRALGPNSDPRVQEALGNLLRDLDREDSLLRDAPVDMESLHLIETESNAGEIGASVADVAARVSELAATHDHGVEVQALNTRLDGLHAQLNIHYGSLNRLESDRARYGGLGVPIILENQISEVKAEVERVEEQVAETRRKVAGQWV